MGDCIFCKIVKGDIPCFKVYEDDRVLAFEDVNPISDGHTLIIPKAHAENIWEISTKDLTAIHLASKKVADAINEVFNPAGVAVLQLNGRGVNQVVMHYHLHPDSPCQRKPGTYHDRMGTYTRRYGCHQADRR